MVKDDAVLSSYVQALEVALISGYEDALTLSAASSTGACRRPSPCCASSPSATTQAQKHTAACYRTGNAKSSSSRIRLLPEKLTSLLVRFSIWQVCGD
eukprot:5258841-Pleurochrysis_carterae.AAC.1